MGAQKVTYNDGIEAAVTTDQARRFLECAVRNWSRANFDRDGLEDFRIELERFRQKVLADALKRPEPSEGREDARLDLQYAAGMQAAAVRLAPFVSKEGADALNEISTLVECRTMPAIAELKATTPEPSEAEKVERVAPTLCNAFRTTVSGNGEYTMVFKFQTMSDLHKADDEWLSLRGVK